MKLYAKDSVVTHAISAVEIDDGRSEQIKAICVPTGPWLGFTFYLTEQEARADWERRIAKAIAAAEKKIKKLKAIDPWTAKIDNKGEEKSDAD